MPPIFFFFFFKLDAKLSGQTLVPSTVVPVPLCPAPLQALVWWQHQGPLCWAVPHSVELSSVSLMVLKAGKLRYKRYKEGLEHKEKLRGHHFVMYLEVYFL